MKKNKTKLFNLILLYISNFQNFDGIKKLNKLLYFTDFKYYEKFSKPITGYNYVKYPRGPVIEDYQKVIEEMVDNKLLKKEKIQVLGENKIYTIHKLEKIVEPNLDLFEINELKIIREVWHENEMKNGKELEEESHRDAPWILSEFNQIIPYFFVKYRNENLDDYRISEIKAEYAYNRAKLLAKEANKESYKSNDYDDIRINEDFNSLTEIYF